MNMHVISVAIAIGAAVIVGVPGTASATVYSLGADWSDVANPNGPGTYRRANVAFPAPVSNWSDFGVAWADSAAFPGFGGSPALLKFDGVGSEAIDASVGDVVGHTNTNDVNSGAGDLSILFTSPIAGSASISGRRNRIQTTNSAPMRKSHPDN